MFHQNYQEQELLSIEDIKYRYYINKAEQVNIFELPQQYTVIKSNYHYQNPNAHCWDVNIITIYENVGPGPLRQVCEFARNYPSFSAEYVRQNGKDYLLTSGDYQSITIVNLTDGIVKSYADPDCLAFGAGFCPIDFCACEDYCWIEGCVWGGDRERMHCDNIDYSNPIKAFNNARWSDDENNFYEDMEDDED